MQRSGRSRRDQYVRAQHGSGRSIADGWRWSSTVCPSSEVCSWQWRHKGDGKPRRGAADRDGVALVEPRRTKERVLVPGLVLWSWLWRWAGRWSEEAKIFVRLLARARAQRRVEQAWRLRWCAIISSAAAKSFAASLLGWRGGHGSDGLAPPSHEVERDQAVALSE